MAISTTSTSGLRMTLFCIGAVQLPVQRSDDGGQIRAHVVLTQVHGYRPHELKHARSLQTRGHRKTNLVSKVEGGSSAGCKGTGLGSSTDTVQVQAWTNHGRWHPEGAQAAPSRWQHQHTPSKSTMPPIIRSC